MNRHPFTTGLAASLLILATAAACSDNASTTASAPKATAPGDASRSAPPDSSPSASSPLEGEWRTSIPKKAALANLRRTGFGDVAEQVVNANSFWKNLDLRIAGDQLLLFTGTGDVMDDGTVTIEGDHMTVEANEVPGHSVLRFKVEGTSLRLFFVSQNRPELKPGLTEEPIIRMLYTTVPWTRSS